ncbi:hypothetical protein IKG12_01020 [Candidatus Saccharibacteria bacterium]|nr:hypothetical protein [Candidatus Saccharibacteria bacterium]
MNEKDEVDNSIPENVLESYCSSILGRDFSSYQADVSANSYASKTKANEVREALEDYIRAEDLMLKELDIEDLNSIMYLEELRAQKEIADWRERGVEINPNDIPNIYDAMEINQKVTAGEYMKSIPEIITKLGNEKFS